MAAVCSSVPKRVERDGTVRSVLGEIMMILSLSSLRVGAEEGLDTSRFSPSNFEASLANTYWKKRQDNNQTIEVRYEVD